MTDTTTDHDLRMLARRWRRARPHSGGLWEWKPSMYGRVEKVVLVDDGSEVAGDDEYERLTGLCDMGDGFEYNYWEGTATTQDAMPGYWRRAPKVQAEGRAACGESQSSAELRSTGE